ncbi:MAG: caspase family protein, partial [Planctomycetota bacterium]
MSRRRAVLIGVEHYDPATGFTALPVVQSDVKAMSDALRSSEFEVDEPLVGIVNRARLMSRITAALQDAVPDETLLIYFSGHGVYHESHTFLVPSEAGIFNPDNEQPHGPDELPEYLVCTDRFKRSIEQSAARNILFVVDSCRKGINYYPEASREGAKAGLRVARHTPDQLRQTQEKAVWFLYACSPGATSHYGQMTGHDAISYFTYFMSRALHADTSPNDVQSIEVFVKDGLNGLSTGDDVAQEIRNEPTAPDDAEFRVICNSSDAIAETNPWRNVVLESSLLRGNEHDCLVEQLRDAVATQVDACWEQWCQARQCFKEDPWLDSEFPIRVVRKLEVLVKHYVEKDSLKSPELALLLTAPFIREAALAAARVSVIQSDPEGAKSGWMDAPQRCVGVMRNGSPRMIRKLDRMREKNDTESIHAISGWILHQSVLCSAEVWQPGADKALPQTVFADIMERLSEDGSLVRTIFELDSLVRLSRVVHANPDRLFRSDGIGDVRTLQYSDRIVGEHQGDNLHVREQVLGGLLCLAGWLAMDVRTLDTVLVDHFGLSAELSLQPSAVVECMQHLAGVWIATDLQQYQLKGSIGHAALDKALRKQTDLISETSRSMSDARWDRDQAMLDWRSMPSSVSTQGLNPELKDEGGRRVPMFTPGKHIEFQLADHEIRDLLMGEKLYGDPSLAIRELYQNALDACRYREARLTYLDRRDRSSLLGQWDDKIDFRQGIDDAGNAYIRCRDTGIGMDLATIENCFAKAGGRYAEATEFLEEQAQWRSLDDPVEFFPNSQFGIGVFSYFMLADEILIRTRRLRPDGHVESTMLEVRVSGSGSLFHIRTVDGGWQDLPDAGTEMTLFLNKTDYRVDDQRIPISVTDTLNRLLWIAEFPTTAEDENGSEKWERYQLKLPPYLRFGNDRCEFAGGKDPDLWWLSGKQGKILCDGIVTDTECPFTVVNLRREYCPEMTVDRKTIRHHDRQRIQDLYRSGVPIELRSHRWLTMEWLWEFNYWHSEAAEALVAKLIEVDATIRLSGASEEIWVRLACVGSVMIDARIIEANPGLPDYSADRIEPSSGEFLPSNLKLSTQMKAERSAAWFSGIGVAAATEKCVGGTTTTFAREDQIALSRDLNGQGPWLEGSVSAIHLLSASRKLEESLEATYARVRCYADLCSLELPAASADELSGLEPTQDDLIALSHDLNGQGPWLEGSVSAIHLLRASRKLEESLEATYARAGRYA